MRGTPGRSKFRPVQKKASWSFRKGLWRLVLWSGLIVGAYLVLCCLGLFLLRWVNPWFTAVQAQRRVESWFAQGPYEKRHKQVPLVKISLHLQHAAIASEDGRFYTHHGIDWQTLEKLLETDLEEGRVSRGGSTITQQLMKNLFVTTHRSFIRKGIEFALSPAAEYWLSKDRILELYLNNIEWGPGVFGAEAAAQYHYHLSAAQLSKEQAARLAVCIPSPRRRRPAQMGLTANIILGRMQQMGW